MGGTNKLWLITSIVLIALAGCTTAQNVGSQSVPQWDTAGAAARAGFNLDVSADSYVDGGSAAGYGLTVEDFGDDIVVSVAVEDAAGLKALYFELDYNPEQYRPMTAEPTDAMGERENVLSLSTFKERGTVTYGQVLANFDWRAGFTGDGTVAQVMFRKEPTPPLARTVSAAPVTAASASILLFDETNPTAELQWDYANQGDYNQDGLVTISDLTPLGANLGQSVAPAKFPRAGNLSVVDGNNDGAITISDLTPLGAALGNGVTGYNVYCTTDNTALPTDPATPSPEAARVGSVLFGDKQGAATERAHFTFDLTTTPAGAYYWVRPYQGTQNAEGIASNVDGNVPKPNLTLQNPPAVGDGSAGNPYEVNQSETYTLILTDPTDGDVSTSGNTVYSTSDPAHVTFASNVMTIGAGADATFTVSASYNGINSNVLSFQLSTGGSGIVISPLDKTAAPWSGVPNVGDGDAGTSANPYILHDSTFNPDSDTDGVYDFAFPLKAEDDQATDLDENALTWGSFPPFVALDINTAPKGEFHVNQFSVGYVFAQDGGLNESNHLYVEVKLDVN